MAVHRRAVRTARRREAPGERLTGPLYHACHRADATAPDDYLELAVLLHHLVAHVPCAHSDAIFVVRVHVRHLARVLRAPGPHGYERDVAGAVCRDERVVGAPRLLLGLYGWGSVKQRSGD